MTIKGRSRDFAYTGLDENDLVEIIDCEFNGQKAYVKTVLTNGIIRVRFKDHFILDEKKYRKGDTRQFHYTYLRRL